MDCIKSHNVKKFSYNRKKTGITFDARPAICVSSTNERKTQVKWVVVIGQKTRRWTKTNNVPPNGSPCPIHDSNQITMNFYIGNFEKNIAGMGMHKIIEQMGKKLI
jgi:hypothetical protein